jgi:hypothetical protein
MNSRQVVEDDRFCQRRPVAFMLPTCALRRRLQRLTAVWRVVSLLSEFWRSVPNPAPDALAAPPKIPSSAPRASPHLSHREPCRVEVRISKC